MVRIANLAKYFALTICLSAFALIVNGQDMKTAAELYNGAATTFQQNPEKALADLDKCIKICKEIETDEANDLLGRAKAVLPRVHFQHAKILFGQSKINESIEAMEKARETAEEINDNKIVKAVERTIPAIYYKQGLNEESVKNFDKAIELCQKAISCNPRFIDPFIVIAKCQDSLKQPEEMLKTLETGIEAAKKYANVPRQTDMRLIATNYLKAEADKQQRAKNHREVISLMSRAIDFDANDPLVYQTIAVSEMELAHHDEVIKNADLALEYADNSTNKAQLYFLRAKAFQSKGMKREACESYKMSAHGQFKEAAEHEMKDVLKCN